MRLPPGYLKKGQEGKVAKLNKGLYGLKQAGLEWYEDLKGTMVAKMGFVCCNADKGVFYKHSGDDHILVGISVDDSSIAGSSLRVVEDFKAEVRKYYEITDLGDISFLLGFEIKRDLKARTISLNQGAYIDSIKKTYLDNDFKPTYVPMAPGATLSSSQSPVAPEDIEFMSTKPYRQLLGALWYAATISVPEITFPLSLCAQYAANPGEAHWRALKQIARYVVTTRDLWLTFGGPGDGFCGYADADWGSQPHRKSYSGYAFLAGCGAITWSTKKQSIVALSSTESEYITLTHASRELIWLRNLWAELTAEQPKEPTVLHDDNQGAIALTRTGAYHARTKHIDIRYHFIRDVVARGDAKIKYCPTEDMVADIFTKALPRQQFEKLRKLLGRRLA